MRQSNRYQRLAIFGLLICIALWSLLENSLKSYLAIRSFNANSTTQLYLPLTSTLYDFPQSNLFSFGNSSSPCVWYIDKGLRNAAMDSRITSVLLHLENVHLTLAQAYTLGEAIKYFRKNGKNVICYAPSLNNKNGGTPAYLLASYCNSILLHQFGEFRLDFVNQHAEQNNPIANQLWESHATALINSNRAGALKVKSIMSESTSYMDKSALNQGFIDNIVKYIPLLENHITLQDYLTVISENESQRKHKVAVISIEGMAADDDKYSALNDHTICPKNVRDVFQKLQQRSDLNTLVINMNICKGSEKAFEEINTTINKVQQKYKSIIYVTGHIPDTKDSLTNPFATHTSYKKESTGGVLNDAIALAIKHSNLDPQTISIELIQPGTILSNLIKDTARLFRSMTSTFQRSWIYITKMI